MASYLLASSSILYGYSGIPICPFFFFFFVVTHKSFLGFGSCADFLLVRASLLAGGPPLNGLVLLLACGTLAGAVDQAVSKSVFLDFVMRQIRQLFSGLDIGNVLRVALGKDDVNLFQRSIRGL